MDLGTDFTLPLVLGGTVEENIERCYEHEFNEKTFGVDLEGFIDIEDLDESSDGEKIVATIRDGRCVTVRIDGPDVEEWTFLGLDVEDTTNEELVAALNDKGINAVAQYNGVALPDHFIVIDPGDSICWWDPGYWGRDGFLEHAVALPQGA